MKKLTLLLILAVAGLRVHATTDTLSRSMLALGDSYTIGEAVGAQDRFPAQTATLLNQKGLKVTDVQYVAKTGWTSADLQGAISRSQFTKTYDIVTLLTGVNDQYQGMDLAGYSDRLAVLIGKAVVLAGNRKDHVFVLSIPDYGVTPYGKGELKISNEIDLFNTVNKQVASQEGVNYVDMTQLSRQVPGDAALTASDGLHPSGKQYRQWSEKLSDAILAKF